MSTCGINFLDKWMAKQLPETATDDPIVISDLADKAMRAADKAAIPNAEISEEVPSVFEVIAEALDHREGGTP
ncbi:hypothetical protein ASD99_24420 [Mesorhizobium sp. Root695]|uniref:DUF768 domain-containing protein n=1 Tax=Mesorhizobium sp. Root695 TaxID=1736589 RepID=UPI000709F0B4|nr:DUF768 domain-containing protein [Mesorhizobium sp. Root695]KRB29804.1 hypothetical protein ASD99_24420 [Mesorhizobium sp. Root695]